jgi:hypothetical protein
VIWLRRRLLRAGFDEFGEAESAVSRLVAFQMAEALGRAGQNADGLATIEEEIARAERTEERWAMAELLRFKGEVLLLQGAPGAAAATEDHFRQALDWARRQGALSWELRAATSLARLLRDADRIREARAISWRRCMAASPKGSGPPICSRRSDCWTNWPEPRTSPGSRSISIGRGCGARINSICLTTTDRDSPGFTRLGARRGHMRPGNPAMPEAC